MLRVEHTPVVIVGAGPAGLSVSACLKQLSVPHVMLDRNLSVGSSWRSHYDRLHLHTDKYHSGLPHFPWGKSLPRYPSRQQVVDYLDQYSSRFELQARLGQEVKVARRWNGHWHVETQDTLFQSSVLVVAAGVNNEPNRPTWPGQELFEGPVLHSSQYKNGSQFKGKRILVVGLGNSGGEIAIDLVEHGALPCISVRSPVNVIPKEVLGIPFLSIGILQQHLPPRLADALNEPVARLLIGNLEKHGLKKPRMGPITQIHETGKVPFIDIGTIDLIRKGAISVRPGIERFTANSVVFTGGQVEAIDGVVLATGFNARVERWLQERSLLNDSGCPTVSGTEAEPDGLYFCGYRVSPTGMLREIAIEAQRMAPDIARCVYGQARSSAAPFN